ncbi:enoyl-CoA hydratase [Tardiphaga sp. 804_B3_N1_9]|uniref:enoyl-CoA hydratase n=1 Tax=Tardiphaga sp. 804_B3_N1_9 TaxID=3240786 RepID=UPI003F290E8A
MSEHINLEKAGGVLTLVMNRPDKKNALTDGMYKVLASELEAAETAVDVRVILIRAVGDMFTSGNDVTEFAAVAMGAPVEKNVTRFLHALANATKPLVAAVNGRAVGIGTTMLLHCDHVVLAEDAQLITPFVNLALVPEAASTLLLPTRVGYVRAFTMFALGDPVNAQDALEWGLANSVVPSAELEASALNVAQRLAKQPIGALTATKKLMRDTDAMTARMNLEGQHFAARLKTPEAKEAFTAFAQRRAPDFTKFS